MNEGKTMCCVSVIVAVYGTLKKNYSNYHHYLSGSTYVGSGETVDKYPLIISGLPYVMSKKGVGHNVDVDVFLVSQSKLKELDGLEGHPSWYERKKIQVLMDEGSVMNSWLYFNDGVGCRLDAMVSKNIPPAA